jgi:uncharacterized protein (DUF2235 family)
MTLYAFDGTGNEDEEGEIKDTNVAKMFHAYDGHSLYLKGVGTRFGIIGKFFGGITGLGGRSRIRKALKDLDRNFAAGDRTIDIIGFSRGAAMALHFANKINDKRGGATIRFLGLWDVVASFGIPGNKLNTGWDLTLPDNVQKCYHAMALDERRGNFKPTHVEAPKGGRSTEGRLQEVWFRGVHSDVGGGKCIGLSSIPLCWMMKRALENGLPVNEAELHRFEDMKKPSAPISKNLDPRKDPLRKIESTDCVHESVQPRGMTGDIEHNDPPAGLTVISG